MNATPLRLVLVDDEPLARARARRLIEQIGGAEIVGEAGSANEAERVIAAAKPDAILLDIQMPGDDGFALLARLEPRPPSCSSPRSTSTPCARSRRTPSTTCSSRFAPSGWPRRSSACAPIWRSPRSCRADWKNCSPPSGARAARVRRSRTSTASPCASGRSS
ncbi:MAG: response regulator [Candidatus Eisenbacteria bacterium]|nr:response regulator [Candidatus Eisenbacteria bacterium]